MSNVNNNLSTSAQQVNMFKKLEKQMYKISDPFFEICVMSNWRIILKEHMDQKSRIKYGFRSNPGWILDSNLG